MLRILMVVALILAVGQASGAVWFGEDTCTSDDCGDAAAGKDCPPNCPTCACAPMIQSLPATRVVVELEPIRTECSRGEPTPERFITTPDPREILHVPKHGA